ncbi:N-acetylmuramoyl-L-alanine amidase [Planctomycetes bacterium Poly30]|uniref:N-acetylmuramoyl-L-alanine amidase n=1 Tax=Saltatorellus ferox TaxID=2528018 RepID=A0A518ERY3_9BACT|nr:N-acetylmuramoyl-L-alanine amidase [Planctomycetes bacterium Poly30]
MLRASRAGDVPSDGLGIETRVSRWRTWIQISCCVFLLHIVLPGCATRPRSSAAPVRGTESQPSSTSSTYRGPSRAPEWSTQPHSWGKLDSIERWLRESDEGGYWQVEGVLQLAEGQLRFAQEGARGAGSTSQDLVAFRRDSALGGFQAAMEAPDATGEQIARAKRGIVTARGILRGVQGPSEASADLTPAVPIGGLVPRSAWSASRADAGNMKPSTGRWNWITVHHSVFAPATGQLSDSLDVVRRIQRQHVDAEDYADIGYHFLIDREGRVIEGRLLKWQGAHAGDSSKNRGNVGICLLGNFEEEHPSRKALASLDKLVLELQRKLRIPRKNVRPHSAWKETKCPGKNLMPWFTRR